MESHKRLKALAKARQASALIRDAIVMMLDGNDLFKSGYNKGIRDAAKVVYDCKEAQMVAVHKRDVGVILTEQIQLLEMK
jgi:hypothetical protein